MTYITFVQLFILEYCLKERAHFRLQVSGNRRQKTSSSAFAILDLSPETRYRLRITAHNAAGSTVQEYDFTTLTYLGATIAPELIIHSDYGGLILRNPAVMLPLFLALVVAVIIAVLFAHQWRRRMIRQIG